MMTLRTPSARNPITKLTLLLFLCHILTATSLKGFNAQVNFLTNITKMQEMKDAGATLVRIDFSRMPLITQTSPYTFNNQNWKRFNETIRWAQQLDLRVVIDPHAMPGAQRHTTVLANDIFWNSADAQNALLRLWKRIAREGKQYGDVILGYDLINEPFGIPENPVFDLNEIYKKLITEVHAIDPDKSFFLEYYRQHYWQIAKEPKYFGIDEEKLGRRIFYSPHIYWPLEYTHQGVDGRSVGRRYPDGEKGWTRSGLEESMKGVIRFAERKGVGHDRMYLGEFSASFCGNCAWDSEKPNERPKNGGDSWLVDAVDLFNKYGWDWSYHSMNGATFWDAKMPEYRWKHIQYLLRRPTQK